VTSLATGPSDRATGPTSLATGPSARATGPSDRETGPSDRETGLTARAAGVASLRVKVPVVRVNVRADSVDRDSESQGSRSVRIAVSHNHLVTKGLGSGELTPARCGNDLPTSDCDFPRSDCDNPRAASHIPRDFRRRAGRFDLECGGLAAALPLGSLLPMPEPSPSRTSAGVAARVSSAVAVSGNQSAFHPGIGFSSHPPLNAVDAVKRRQ